MLIHYTEDIINSNSFIETYCGLLFSPIARRWDSSLKATHNKNEISCEKCLVQLSNKKG